MNRLISLSNRRSKASLVSTFNDESKLKPLKNPLDWKIVYKVITSYILFIYMISKLTNFNNFSMVHNSF